MHIYTNIMLDFVSYETPYEVDIEMTSSVDIFSSTSRKEQEFMEMGSLARVDDKMNGLGILLLAWDFLEYLFNVFNVFILT